MSQHAIPAKPMDHILRALNVKRSELQAVAWSFAYFFCVLSSYYMLRPVRDTMAIVSGVITIPVLFSGTFVAMLLITPVFGWIASRFPRKQFLPWVYYFFISNILIFFAFFTYAEHHEVDQVWIGRSFFVWLSVFNLFVVTVFWSFMADIYTRTQSRRLFGVISAGGSTGAILGPFITSELVDDIGFRNLLPLSALLLLAGVFCIYQLRRWVRHSGAADGSTSIESDRAMGGTALAGARTVFSNSYFKSIALMLVLANFVGVATYTFLAELVRQNFATTDLQIQVFGRIDGTINILSFVGQFFLVGRSVKTFGAGTTLALLPIVSAIGFALMAINPVFAVMAVLQVVRRSLTFGFAKPTSDMLYSVVTPEQKYKVKNFIDTAIYRTGDVVAAWTLFFLAGLGMSGIALLCVPVSMIWSVVAFRVGREYNRLFAAADIEQGDET